MCSNCESRASRADGIDLSGADFHFSGVRNGYGGFGYISANYGERLYAYLGYLTDYQTIPLYNSTINYDGRTYYASFSGSVSASGTVPAYAPYPNGNGDESVVIPALVQGSFTACPTSGPSPYAPCDASLPTYTLSFSTPGYIQFSFGNEGSYLILGNISANAPVPEPSSFVLLFVGLMLLPKSVSLFRNHLHSK